MYTHVLLFGRDQESERIGESFEDLDMVVIREFRDQYSPLRSPFQLSGFPIYSTRLEQLQAQMKEWRPRKIKQLATRGYADPLNYYIFWWSVIVGIVTTLTLGASIATAYASFQLLKDS
jgi:hypothetical protein